MDTHIDNYKVQSKLTGEIYAYFSHIGINVRHTNHSWRNRTRDSAYSYSGNPSTTEAIRYLKTHLLNKCIPPSMDTS